MVSSEHGILIQRPWQVVPVGHTCFLYLQPGGQVPLLRLPAPPRVLPEPEATMEGREHTCRLALPSIVHVVFGRATMSEQRHWSEHVMGRGVGG
jgi:hypothetical protein